MAHKNHQFYGHPLWYKPWLFSRALIVPDISFDTSKLLAADAFLIQFSKANSIK